MKDLHGRKRLEQACNSNATFDVESFANNVIEIFMNSVYIV